MTVAIVQGAIPQDQKWLDSNRDTTLSLYHDLTEHVLGRRLIVWPEAALPDPANEHIPYITDLYRDARTHGSALVFGVLRVSDDGEHYYNSVLALDDRLSWYDKDHLVPFAEFFPVPAFVRSWLRLRNLPYADFTRGGADQPPLAAGGLKLATTVCYEDAYGSSMLKALRSADALVNVTNDAWFGHSSARHQHFQIARMRAIESGRFLIRAANDGISGVIGPRGEVVARAPEFEPYDLLATVTPRMGLPPYAHVGNWLVIILSSAALVCGLWVRNHGGRPAAAPASGGSPTGGRPTRDAMSGSSPAGGRRPAVCQPVARQPRARHPYRQPPAPGRRLRPSHKSPHGHAKCCSLSGTTPDESESIATEPVATAIPQPPDTGVEHECLASRNGPSGIARDSVQNPARGPARFVAGAVPLTRTRGVLARSERSVVPSGLAGPVGGCGGGSGSRAARFLTARGTIRTGRRERGGRGEDANCQRSPGPVTE